MAGIRYAIDPLDPRAPSRDLWEQLSEDERRAVVASLPSEIERASPPEGDAHRLPKQSLLEALEGYFGRIGRRVYLSSELPVYYPDESMFAPDLIAVLDVEPHPRPSWVVSREQRGLDLALEIHVAGDRDKDFRRNVERFARLGIPEYFAFDAPAERLLGYRLPQPDARHYEPIIPQQGAWPSRVLGLELGLASGRLRWMAGGAPLPDAKELISRLTSLTDDALRRAEEQARRAEEEARRAERLAERLRELGLDPDADD